MKAPSASAIRLLFALVYVCLFSASTWCETLPFRSYTTADGLAHDHVNRIVRDSRGFLWFCTSEGLSRFDGYEFKNYTRNDGLPHRGISDLLETRDGTLWIGTGDGIVLFNPYGVAGAGNDPVPAMFRVFRPDDGRDPDHDWSVQDLVEDHEGIIWVASSTGLYRLFGSNDERHLERFDVPAAALNRSEVVVRLIEDHTHSVWAAMGTGVYRILPDRTTIETVEEHSRVEAMLEDRQHRVWLGTGGAEIEGHGLHLYSFPTDEPKLERVFDHKDGLVSDHWMNALLETSDGRILVGNDLCEYTPQTDNAGRQFRVLNTEGVTALGEDAGGNLWFGTETSGVRRIARNGFTAFTTKDGLKNNFVTGIDVDTEGSVFVLSSDTAISRFNGRGFETVSPLRMLQPNWGVGQISFRDSRGEWWIESGYGLQRYPRTARFEDLAHTPPLKTYTTRDGLFADGVFRLFEDSRGDIWICVIGDIVDTLLRWERATETLHPYTADADGLPRRNGPTAFGEDFAGDIWIGYYGGGVVRFQNGRFDVFDKQDGLPPGLVNNIFTDSSGRVWVAMNTSGIVRIDDPTSDEKPHLTTMTTRDGLSSDQAKCVTEDNFGRIYIASGRGVNRLDLATGRLKLFTQADGLPENLVTQCRRDPTGTLWFGTGAGLARYVPSQEEKTEPPPVLISGVRANGGLIRKLSELGETSVDGLELSSDQRQIQIDFLALGFSTGETLRYQYKLGDADWSQPSTQRTVNLGLSPGNYRFYVRAGTADGVMSAVPASVSFSIARPIWQRWWFIAVLTLALAVIIYAAYSYRLRRLIELEKVRTRIATDLHDDIGASLSKISILSEVVHQRIKPIVGGNGEIDRPLDQIAETSRDLVDSMSDIVWAINPERDHLGDLVQRMRNLASEMTELADIRLRFSSAGVDGDADLSLGADIRREIYLIFKETVNNLVKHSDCGTAEIEVRRDGDALVIRVADDGNGFDVSAAGNADGTSRGGNGLPNMRRRAAAHGGTYEVSSVRGAGTTAILRVPLGTGLRGGRLRDLFSRP